jgi:hypothetical protein
VTTPEELATLLGCDDLAPGGSRKVHSPLRDERTASLNVTHSKDGKWLFHDHGAKHATFEDFVAALSNGHHDVTGITARKGASKPEGHMVAAYDYVDEAGKQLFQVVRYEPKEFRQRRKIGGRWVYDLNGVSRVLYNLPEVIAAAQRGEPVYIVEGEKDVEALAAEGVAATCNPGGAGKWDAAYAQYLVGADVRIVQDKDDSGVGARHARQIKRSLIGVAHSVRVYEALTGKDASDHIDAGHVLADLVPADRFTPVDLGKVMEAGIDPPAFLIDGVHYAERAHAIAGAPGDGKTLFELGICAEIMRRGETVAWFDEENGPSVVAARLASFGVTPEEASAHFVYYPFSEPTLDDADELVAEMAALAPVLVVFDSGADMYAAASLNENDNMDMTRWAISFSQKLSREYSIATCVLEHVAKAGDSNYQRGAGAKKAKVDALFMLEVRAPFDHETVGEIELVRAKDRLAHLPPRVRYRIGGNGKGATTFERVEVEDIEQERAVDAKRKREAYKSEAVKALREHDAHNREHGLSQRQLTSLLSPAPQAFKNEVVQELANDPRTPVKVRPGPRGSLIYWVEKGDSRD